MIGLEGIGLFVNPEQAYQMGVIIGFAGGLCLGCLLGRLGRRGTSDQ